MNTVDLLSLDGWLTQHRAEFVDQGLGCVGAGFVDHSVNVVEKGGRVKGEEEEEDVEEEGEGGGGGGGVKKDQVNILPTATIPSQESHCLCTSSSSSRSSASR